MIHKLISCQNLLRNLLENRYTEFYYLLLNQNLQNEIL
jgi:hypothetical protein